MDGLETNNAETQTTQPGAAATAETTTAGTTTTEQNTDQTPEKVSALQKFIDGLFGGKKSEETKDDPKDAEKPSGDDPKKEVNKSFSQDDVNAAIDAAKKQWQDEQSEQERLKKLPPEEREKAEQEKKDKELETLRSQLLQRDLKEKAVSALDKEGFPVKLAETLDFSSKENMEQSLKNTMDIFRDSLKVAIETRLKGKTPEGLGGAARTENLIVDQIAKNIRGGLM